MRQFVQSTVVFTLIILLGSSARAEDAYYSVPLNDLKTLDGKIAMPNREAIPWHDWERISRLEPVIHVDQPGAHAYLVIADAGLPGPGLWVNRKQDLSDVAVVLSGPAGADLTGQIYTASPDGTGMTALKFSVPGGPADSKMRTAFFEGKRNHYQGLVNRRLPGAAWFRYQARQAAIDAGQKPDELDAPNRNADGQQDDYSETIDLFSGGRAVSENLQLNRALFPRAGGDRTVAIDSIEGISVKAMDWKPLIADLHPATDKLAALIAGDQHGIFFPSFAAAMKTFDQADLRATPVFEQFESASEDAGTRERYRRQLCLPETVMGRLLGPGAIAEMAITGSDPYLRVGSDVAILFSPTGKLNLHEMLASTMARAAADGAGPDGPAVMNQAGVGGLSCTSWISPARRICAYLATVDGVEVVTNSPVQLQRMADIRSGNTPALTADPEYTFFRNRYSRSSADESAFAILPDAAIRRWCSPKWRIADSRRTRAAAVMADMQARHADELIAGKVKSEPATNPADQDLNMTLAGVQSAVYGSLEFMTPISELQIDKVTQAEADMYGRWRNTYQQNWSNYFDPIGVSLSVDQTRTAVDLSVMPLIAGSEYAELMSLSSGVKIGDDTGDPHDALFHVAMALNRDSQQMKQGAGMLVGIGGANIDPLGWIGPTAALYVDNDPIWKDLAAAKAPDEFAESHISDFPVVLYLQSSNALKLTAFLVALHGFVDASAPGMTLWTPEKYGDFTYTKISPSDQAKAGNAQMKNTAVCYAVAGGALLVSPNEPALRRAIDRQTARAAAATQPTSVKPGDPLPWLGESFCAQIDVATAEKAFLKVMEGNYEPDAQDRAWASLPILNEWHQRFASIDPAQVQQQLFQVQLRDPAGGKYVWNEALQTMESANYGCPQKPKDGPVWPSGFENIGKANFGITFENQGMRAKIELQQSGK